jgi:hypothetical protein
LGNRVLPQGFSVIVFGRKVGVSVKTTPVCTGDSVGM